MSELSDLLTSMSFKAIYGSSVPHRLIYSEYGDPVKVVRKQEQPMMKPKENEVLVKMLAAPLNPSDIYMIYGKYPVKANLPAVPGKEGVGEVVKVGDGVEDFSVGDRVVPFLGHHGTWRTHVVFPKDHLMKVPKDLGIVEAATLIVNPPTAYRMLSDFVSVKPGDTVIQNGANSAVGQNVIQMCKVWGVHSVNIIRNRPEVGELKRFLTDLGATHVLTEEELATTDLFKSGELEKPKLALNSVGGQSALNLLQHLQNGGHMVTYGGISGDPVPVPTPALIFNDVHLHGFWITEWMKRNANNPDRIKMFGEIISMITEKKLQGPGFKMVHFENYEEALKNCMTVKGMAGKKYILEFAEKKN